MLKRSGAEIFVFAGMPENAAKVIRMAAGLNWHPVFITNQMASSIATALKPAGLENALGVITAAFLKDADDPAWKDEQAAGDWQAFVDKYNRAGGKDDSSAVFGYAAAETLAQVLKQCGNDLSRENVHEASRVPQGLPRLHFATWDQDQYRALGLSADQTPATGSIRRPHMATDWRSARNGFLQRPKVAVAGPGVV